MADFYSWTYIENLSPDLRPVLLLAASVALIGRRFARSDLAGIRSCPPGMLFLVVVMLGASLLWIATTANGRYGLPVLLLVGPLLALTIQSLLTAKQWGLRLCFAIVVLQAANIHLAGSQRWDVADWTEKWIDVNVPDKFKHEPFSFISLGTSGSNSYIIPFLHPKSEFASIAGATFAFDPAGPGSDRLHAQFARAGDRLRTLITARREGTIPPETEILKIDRLLAPWKLQVNRNDCEFITGTLSSKPIPQSKEKWTAETELQYRLHSRMISCAVTKGQGEDAITKARRARIQQAFNKLEEYCPRLFSPRGWYLTNTGLGWHRAYLTSDIIVYERRGRLEYSRFEFGPFDVPLGSVDSWLNGVGNMKCERPPRHFLAD